ncbi:mycothiol transferase [Cryobacterium sp. AP23]
MLSTDLMRDAFSRVQGTVHASLVGAGPDLLGYRVDHEANTIAWLIWHLTRVQDDHIAALAEEPQVWTDGWQKRFNLPFPAAATGYGQSAGDVADVRAGADLLLGYFDAVHERTLAYLDTLTEDDFSRVVDTRWTPPVTLAVRLVSVIADDLEHAGQAAYVRGLAQRAGLH